MNLALKKEMNLKKESLNWIPLRRFCLVFTMFTVVMLFNSKGYAQSKVVSLDMKNVSVEQVLNSIESKTVYRFLYNKQLVDVNRKITIVIDKQEISQVLVEIFKGTDIKFNISGKQIVLSKLEKKLVSESQRKISGVVIDEKGESIIGATVILKGTKIGTVTDVNGKFALEVPGNSQIQITYIGFAPRIIDIDDKTNFNISLFEDTKKLDEVVVVAYGVQKKVNLSGSVSSVNFENLGETRAVTNLSQGLEGTIPGLLAQQSSGQPGSDGTSITIRGQGTLNNSSPLVIVDGIVGSLSDVSPNDVASISVLKDAASSSIYGSRAANGVILVTTKQGSKDKTRITYNGYYGLQNPTFPIQIVDNYPQYMETINQAYKNSGNIAPYGQSIIDEWRANSPLDPLVYPNTNWFNAVFKPSVTQEHTVQASGGNDKINYLVSVGYFGNNGSMPKTDFNKISFRANLNAQVTPWFTLGTILNGYNSTQQLADVSTYMGYISNSSPGTLPRSPDGRTGGEWAPGGTVQANNVFSNFDQTNDLQTTTRFLGKLSALITISKNFTWNNSVSVTINNGFENQNNQPTQLWNFKTNTVLRNSGTITTTLLNSYTLYSRLVVDSYLKYSLKIKKDNSIDFIAGYNQEYEKETGTASTAFDLLSIETPVMNTATTPSTIKGGYADRALRSYFGRLNYNFADKYLLEANLRYDGSSKFSKDGRWGLFPSFSGAWRLSQEGFMKEVTFIDNLKLRASWGKLGNNRTDDYGTQAIYKSANVVLGEIVTPGAAPSALTNSTLKWETTSMTNIGTDFGLFKSRLNIVFDAFYKLTNDILIKLPIPTVLGGLSAPNQNAGIVSNRGFEFSLSWNDKIGKSFKYGISGNYTFVRSRVEKYRGTVATYSGNTILQEGLKIYPFYIREVESIATQDKIDEMIAAGYKFYPSTPKPGDFIYKDQQKEGETGYKIINDDDRVVKGTSVPEDYFGLTLSAEYAGFDFSVLFQGIAGVNNYLNSTWYTNVLKNGSLINKKFLNAWSIDNPTSKIPAITSDDAGRNTVANDFWLQDGSYVRVKNIQLGYTFSRQLTKKIGIQRLRLYASAENMFTLTRFEGLDPEVSATDSYPNMKRIVSGISITF